MSDDLRHWEQLGTCFAPADAPAWDDYTTWTGSVVQDGAELWHLFYTGTSRAENGLVQRIGHATSRDLHTWRRVGDGLCLDLSGQAYETVKPDTWHDRAMRDPWVMPDPEGSGWLMFFTARAAGIAEPNAAGAIGFATSPDLTTWTLQPPVFTGGYGQLEVPQVFGLKGIWYCLFCTTAAHFSEGQAALCAPVDGTHYLIADSPRGPWRIAPGFLDGALPCRRYAGRVVDLPDGPHLIGFAHTIEGAFSGTLTDPEPLSVDACGHLHLPETPGDAI